MSELVRLSNQGTLEEATVLTTSFFRYLRFSVLVSSGLWHILLHFTTMTIIKKQADTVFISIV